MSAPKIECNVPAVSQPPVERATPRLPELRSANFEREQAEAQAQNLLLLRLQNDILRIASIPSSDAAIAQLLRSAYETLGFTRAIYFGVDRERGIEARWQLDGSPDVTPSFEVADVGRESSLLRVLRVTASAGFGKSDETAPLRNARGPYVLSPLAQGATTFGILYLDGYTAGDVPGSHLQLVQALSKAASIAIGNSALLARARELASRDALTGLFNRRALSERLPMELAVCRDQGHSLTYLMIDFDDLKRVNDSRGHVQGDAVLRRVAQTLARNSRAGDIVGRYGGDEFVMMLPAVHGDLAEVLVTRLSQELRSEGLSCSIGAAVFPRDALEEAGLTLAADRALYAIKAAGKNGFSFA